MNATKQTTTKNAKIICVIAAISFRINAFHKTKIPFFDKIDVNILPIWYRKGT